MTSLSDRRVIWFMVVLLMAALLVVGGAAPAFAVDCSDFPYEGEAGMIASDCRENTVDPGVDNILDRADLFEPQANALFNHYGFSDVWLWFAPETTKTFNPNDTTTWSFCNTYDHVSNTGFFTSGGFVCDTAIPPLGFATVLSSFDLSQVSPVIMRVFEYGGGFISRACGNFSDGDTPDPEPKIRVEKFHDFDRDGVQDANEPPMAGVEFKIGRQSSLVGQVDEVFGTLSTNSNGEIVFPLVGEGPGTYYFEEVVPSGMYITTPGGDTHTVNVPFGAGDETFDANPFGNSETETEVEKTFKLIDGPEELEVGVPATFTLESTLINGGPAGPVKVRETLTVTGPEDCVIEDEETVRDVTLGRPGVSGQEPSAKVFVDEVTVTCSLPSFHEFTFTNLIEVISVGVSDINLGNNSVTFGETRPVFADADLSLENANLDCTPDPLVEQTFTCDFSVDIVNLGPFGPTDATVVVDLAQPSDCSGAESRELVAPDIGVLSPYTVSTSWTLECTDRSFHPFQVSANVTADDIHVRDIEGNNDAVADFTVEVFEIANLVADGITIVCDELWAGDPFTCSVDVTVHNDGPGDNVIALVSAELLGSGTCTVTPDRFQESPTVLPSSGVSQTFQFAFSVDCAGELTLHTFTAVGRIAQDEPHPIDDPVDNEVRLRWVPIDFKPNSDPNSYNVGRGGVASVAILGTADFDPFAEVDTATLFFGPTGTEAAVVRCASEPEDVNSDGYGDMTCKFRNKDMGFVVGDTLAILTGQLLNGDAFMSADEIRVIG